MKLRVQLWRAYFLTGLAVVLPAVLSLIILKWGFGTVAGITDTLLFFLPRVLTHGDEGRGPIVWYWSLAAFVLAVLLIIAVGRATRYYVGKRVIAAVDQLMRRVPLLNKVYGIIQQVNQAFGASQKSAFKQVVLVQYPRAGIYSIGFLTSDEMPEPGVRVGQPLKGVFIPTTPNPTSGFLIMVPAGEIIHLDMTVADGIKYVISLGAIVPSYQVEDARPPAPRSPPAGA